MPGISPGFGSSLAEAGAVCFDNQKHQEGVAITISGDFQGEYPVFWQTIDDQMRRCWNDAEEATEHGAYGVAILLIVTLTEYTVIQRSSKTTGFDYWLGKKDDDGLPFIKEARLEVSGIRNGAESTVNSRVNQKLLQVSPTDETKLPAYIVVVEFSKPQSKVIKK